MRIDGQCHCGAIAWEAEIDPEKIIICNCTDCQVLSGTAFRTVGIVPAERFRLLRGEPRIYRKTGDSGNVRRQTFCGTCGTPLWACADSDAPPAYNLRLGTARQRDTLVPRAHYWARSAVSWLDLIPGLPRHERQ